MLPDVRAHQLMLARLAFEHGCVVAHKREHRHQRERQPQLAQAVGRARVVDGHLRRRAAAHHAGAVRVALAQVQVHELVAALREELQRARRAEGW